MSSLDWSSTSGNGFVDLNKAFQRNNVTQDTLSMKILPEDRSTSSVP